MSSGRRAAAGECRSRRRKLRVSSATRRAAAAPWRDVKSSQVESSSDSASSEPLFQKFPFSQLSPLTTHPALAARRAAGADWLLMLHPCCTCEHRGSHGVLSSGLASGRVWSGQPQGLGAEVEKHVCGLGNRLDAQRCLLLRTKDAQCAMGHQAGRWAKHPEMNHLGPSQVTLPERTTGLAALDLDWTQRTTGTASERIPPS